MRNNMKNRSVDIHHVRVALKKFKEGTITENDMMLIFEKHIEYIREVDLDIMNMDVKRKSPKYDNYAIEAPFRRKCYDYLKKNHKPGSVKGVSLWTLVTNLLTEQGYSRGSLSEKEFCKKHLA